MSDFETKELIISEEDIQAFKRLDLCLSHHFEEISRTTIKELFKKGLISSSEKLELKKLPKMGTSISIKVPPPEPMNAEPENIPLDIIFEDEHLLIINKPAGLVVHPAPGNYTGTLVNALLWHFSNIEKIGDQIRPGIVHRLDKGTTGLMVAAKTQQAFDGLSLLFSEHNITRKYEAICVGKSVPIHGKIESTIGRHPQNRLKMAINVRNGREATTHFKRIASYGPFHHVECTLETGRTHQIRVHLTTIKKAPIMLDPIYGNATQDLLRLKKLLPEAPIENYAYPLLHAKILGFTHPVTKEELLFEQSPPKYFQEMLDLLKNLKKDE
jgi:23S rRNA pseudouridine1911/1915/1917 synthase